MASRCTFLKLHYRASVSIGVRVTSIHLPFQVRVRAAPSLTDSGAQLNAMAAKPDLGDLDPSIGLSRDSGNHARSNQA